MKAQHTCCYVLRCSFHGSRYPTHHSTSQKTEYCNIHFFVVEVEPHLKLLAKFFKKLTETDWDLKMNIISQECPWEQFLHPTSSQEPFRKNSMFIIKLGGSNLTSLSTSINNAPSWHTGHCVHMDYHVCMHWAATLSFSWANPFWWWNTYW